MKRPEGRKNTGAKREPVDASHPRAINSANVSLVLACKTEISRALVSLRFELENSAINVVHIDRAFFIPGRVLAEA